MHKIPGGCIYWCLHCCEALYCCPAAVHVPAKTTNSRLCLVPKQLSKHVLLHTVDVKFCCKLSTMVVWLELVSALFVHGVLRRESPTGVSVGCVNRPLFVSGFSFREPEANTGASFPLHMLKIIHHVLLCVAAPWTVCRPHVLACLHSDCTR